MSIATTIQSMQNHTSNAYTMIGYGTDLTGTNKNLENLSTSIFNAFLEALRNPNTLFTNLPKKSGTGANITLNDTANAPMRIELGSRALEQATSILPSEYQQVEYIENLNSRYFDTGFKPNNNTKVEAVASVNELSSSGKFLFATRNNARTDIFCGLIWTDNKVSGGYGNSNLYQSEVVQNIDEKFTLTLDKNLLYHNGTLLQTFITQTFTSENNLYLFTANTAGSPDSQVFRGKLYSCKIYDNGTLVRNFIPCYKISDNTIGLYDIANNQFYSNLGSGTIQKGSNTILPNPNYPQDIHTISGSNTIKVEGRNLIPFTNQNFTVNNVNYLVQDGSLIFNGTSTSETSSKNANFKNNFNFTLEAGTYTISHKTGIMAVYVYNYNDDSSSLATLGTDAASTTFTLNAKTQVYIGFYVYQKTFNNVNSEIMISKNGGEYIPYTLQEADIDLGTNLIGLDTAQYKVDLKTGDKITFRNETTTSIVINFYTNYGDSTRNDFWYIDPNSSRTISATHDTKAIAWLSTIPRTGNGIAWANYGSSILPYSTYKEPIEYCKIGNYEDKFIRTSGKNKANPELELGTIDANGVLQNSTTQLRSKNYMDIGTATTLYFKRTDSTNMKLRFYDENYNFTGTSSSVQTLEISRSVPTNSKYLKITMDITNLNYMTQYNVMISTENIPYEPYGSNEWYIKKNIGKVVLDGSESWSDFSLGDTNFRCQYDVALPNILTPPSNPAVLLCNYFAPANRDNVYAKTQVGIAQYGSTLGKIFFCAPNSILSEQTINGWKTWLSTHNLIVNYLYATPTYTQITGTLANQLENVYKNMLSQNEQTNISQENNDLSFELSVLAIEEL